jgi:hypothetical protein
MLLVVFTFYFNLIYFNTLLKKMLIFGLISKKTTRLGGGWNVDDQNVDRAKISERRNGLFS